MKDLNQCRIEIDEIDKQMIQLFEKRMNIAKDVVSYKLENNMEIFQREREKQVIDKNLKYIKNDSLKDYASYFIQNMMNISKSYQATFVPPQSRIELSLPKKENITVGFQGVNGSFSEAALEQYFGKDTNRKNYENFEDVFRALKNKEIDYGIVPLENSSTGAINDNYDLIRDYDFYIVGEQSISIAQHLLGMKGSKIEELREVYSHPQGLLQTSKFLEQHPYITGIHYPNTAIAAKYVADHQDPTLAAIASKKAAELYGLEVLQENIHNEKTNHTRFIIFKENLEKNNNANCVSIVFTLAHKVGALYQIMKIINDHHINLLHIESRPVQHTPWEYYFYMDFEGNVEDMNIIYALEDMIAHTNTLRILGNYEKK